MNLAHDSASAVQSAASFSLRKKRLQELRREMQAGMNHVDDGTSWTRRLVYVLILIALPFLAWELGAQLTSTPGSENISHHTGLPPAPTSAQPQIEATAETTQGETVSVPPPPPAPKTASPLQVQKVEYIHELLASVTDVKCIKLLFLHIPKAGGTTIRRFFETHGHTYDPKAKVVPTGPGQRRTFTFITEEHMGSFSSVFAQEARNPMKYPFLTLEAHHHLKDVTGTFIPAWRKLRKKYEQAGCKVLLFSHMRDPQSLIASAFSFNTRTEHVEKEFAKWNRLGRKGKPPYPRRQLPIYWDNVRRCGASNYMLKWLHDPQPAGWLGKSDPPQQTIERWVEDASSVFTNDFDYVANLDNLEPLMTLLHALMQIQECTAMTGKTRNHGLQRDDKHTIPKDVVLPGKRVCGTDQQGRLLKVLDQLQRSSHPQRMAPEVLQSVWAGDRAVFDHVTDFFRAIDVQIVKSAAETFTKCKDVFSKLKVDTHTSTY